MNISRILNDMTNYYTLHKLTYVFITKMKNKSSTFTKLISSMYVSSVEYLKVYTVNTFA